MYMLIKGFSMKRLFRNIFKVFAVFCVFWILYGILVVNHKLQGGHVKFTEVVLPETTRDLPETSTITVVPDTTPQTFPLETIFECNLPPSNVQKNASRDRNLPMCPCVPSNLRPYEPYDNGSLVTFDGMQKLYPDVKEGHWNPKECIPRHKMVLIVPFRDREDHLRHFLRVIHRFLQKQKLDYTIIVAEQVAPLTFNKAKLMNAAYAEAKKLTHFDCVVFHDVDMLPEDERNLYTCPSGIRHQGLAIDIYNYKMIYWPFIGGVSVFRPDSYEAVDGHSNSFWGWGAEDDNIYRRVMRQKLDFRRPPLEIARYHMFAHDRDATNSKNPNRVAMIGKYDDGLSTLTYKLLGRRRKALYTWMLFDLTDGTTTSRKLSTLASTLSSNVTVAPTGIRNTSRKNGV